MKSKFWNYVLYNYFRKIKSKSFIGFNIFLILVGLLISQLGSIVKFFNETFDYSETIYIVDETNQLYSQFQKDFNNLLKMNNCNEVQVFCIRQLHLDYE